MNIYKFFPWFNHISQAVCCADQLHCCPAGYHCSSAAQSCVKDDLPWYRLPWLKHMPAKEPVSTLFEFSLPEFDSNVILERPLDAGAGVVRCDNMYYCNDYSVCCLQRSGNWGCCPQANVSAIRRVFFLSNLLFSTSFTVGWSTFDT